MRAYSQRYDAALVMAARAHRTQLRKGTDIPYIVHTVHVATILLRHGFREELVLAGLLHDVIEDCGVAEAQLAETFGEEVARLVVAVSEPKGEVSWEEAKQHKLDQLATGGPEVAALKAADAIHNTRSILNDLSSDGPAVWGRFKRGAGPTITYYQEILVRVRAQLGDHPLVEELAEAVGELAGVDGGR